MLYDNVLKFHGTWRNYQKRVLDRSAKYMSDGKIHIVAAPGSGKTTLGIELIKRSNQPALILTPSITIREQWIERITTGFLQEGYKPEDYLSQDIKNPKAITAITYQALYSAMRRLKGKLTDEGAEEGRSAGETKAEAEVMETETAEAAEETLFAQTPVEEVDFSGFDLPATVRKANIQLICLDECHHLRSEWWKALEEFMKETGEKTIVSLTATPPYDSTNAMWARYIDLCGEIDEEITVPELVKEGSLCPHQDYVYFNYPTREEKEVVEAFKEHAEELTNQLMADEEFAKIIAGHPGMQHIEEAGERFLDKPSYLSALLIFFREKSIPFDSYLVKLLGAKKLPRMEPKWMEILLQGFLYDDAEAYFCDSVYREQLENKCKRAGLIQKRKVCFVVNDKIEKMLISSKGKIESIKQIVKAEYAGMGKELRLLILTDYIKKEYLKTIGNPEKDTEALGVIPFFEMLRRQPNQGLRLGVLCGSVVIIPIEAKEALEQTIEGVGAVTYTEFSGQEEIPYVRVNAVGDSHFLTAAVTGIFTKGWIHVLIGTKSLLGEGWDAPCINSLILASFVGSYMLSNQMRGRAIRVMKGNPDKTSNIWHLVCMKEKKLLLGQGADTENAQAGGREEYSEDFLLLIRRMEHFLGVHYKEDTIESGIDRLDIMKKPFTKSRIMSMNQEMLSMAGKRERLKKRWQTALEIHEKMEVSTEAEVMPKGSFVLVLINAIVVTFFNALIAIFFLGLMISQLTLEYRNNTVTVLFAIAEAVALTLTCFYGARVLALSTPLRRIKEIGKGVLKAMKKKELLTDNRVGIEVESMQGVFYGISLKGGSARDKELFARCMYEFFDPIDNQRYLVVNKKQRKKIGSYFCIPEAFAKNKEDAAMFASCLKSVLREAEPVYTRTEAGRQLLLEGRIYAFANQQQRCVTKKKVKSALV